MPDMASESSWVATRLLTILDRYCSEKKFGVPVTAEFSYQCFPARPGLVRKPDVSVILADRETFIPPKIHCKEAPGLLVEVVSPGNSSTDIIEKVEEFLGAGTPLVWVVEPELRLVFIHRADGTVTKLREPAELTGENGAPRVLGQTLRFLAPCACECLRHSRDPMPCRTKVHSGSRDDRSRVGLLVVLLGVLGDPTENLVNCARITQPDGTTTMHVDFFGLGGYTRTSKDSKAFDTECMIYPIIESAVIISLAAVLSGFGGYLFARWRGMA